MPIETAEGQGFVVGRNAVWVCLGDSITEAPDGYVAVMQNLLAAAYPERNIRLVNAGVSGNRAPEMLVRLQADVVERRPDWVSIHVGINDIWHGFTDFESGRVLPAGDGPRGVPLEAYAAQVEQMVARLREATDARIVLLTPTVIGEDVENAASVTNVKLDRYASAMTEIAERHGTFLVPLREEFKRAILAGRAANQAYCLTTDGVHLNAVGNFVMALGVLYTLGFGTM